MTIAIGLTAILLTLLFRFLVENTRFEQKVDQATQAVLERQRTIERIDSILTSLESPEKGGSFFYTAEFPDDVVTKSLVVSFNAGIDPDPEYSHVLTARIYLTEQGELMLGYWPQNKKSYRTEVLLQHVHNLEWQFLGPKLDKDPKVPVIAGHWAWLKDWPKNREGMPEIVRLQLWCGPGKSKDPNLQLAFVLPVLTPVSMVK
jgi:hypothetical protein